MRVLRSLRAATLLLALAGVGCDRPEAPTAPRALTPASAPRGDLLGTTTGAVTGTAGSATRLVCPTDQALVATGVVGPAGGALEAGGFRVDFPADAVPQPETFTLQVLAGSYVDIEVHAEGHAHYQFAVPVKVTMDLSRCGLLPSGLGAWYVDDATGALLEPMGGELDLLTRKLRFRTSHFSGYTIAW